MTTLLSREELAAGIEAGTVTVVDALPASYYEKAHLPGAVNLEESAVQTSAATLLPAKDAAIVTYCAGPACPNSHRVAAALEKLGYTDVRVYREGIADWSEAGLPVESGAAAPTAR